MDLDWLIERKWPWVIGLVIIVLIIIWCNCGRTCWNDDGISNSDDHQIPENVRPVEGGNSTEVQVDGAVLDEFGDACCQDVPNVLNVEELDDTDEAAGFGPRAEETIVEATLTPREVVSESGSFKRSTIEMEEPGAVDLNTAPIEFADASPSSIENPIENKDEFNLHRAEARTLCYKETLC